jgi:hypothetical protein
MKFLSDEDWFYYHEQIKGSSYKISLFTGSHGCCLRITVMLPGQGFLWQFVLIMLKLQSPAQEI